MSILFYVFLGIAIDVGILIVLKKMTGDRPKMSYGEYLQKHGSVADSNPNSYSNYRNYM
jgi:hypothetical protein